MTMKHTYLISKSCHWAESKMEWLIDRIFDMQASFISEITSLIITTYSRDTLILPQVAHLFNLTKKARLRNRDGDLRHL